MLLRVLFDHLEFEVNLFSSRDRVQVLLPEFSNESQRRKAVIEVDQKLEPGQLPQIQDRSLERHAGETERSCRNGKTARSSVRLRNE